MAAGADIAEKVDPGLSTTRIGIISAILRQFCQW
jgi:hypothetical protein